MCLFSAVIVVNRLQNLTFWLVSHLYGWCGGETSTRNLLLLGFSSVSRCLLVTLRPLNKARPEHCTWIILFNLIPSQGWRVNSRFPALQRLKQEDCHEPEASVGYIDTLGYSTMSCLKTNKQISKQNERERKTERENIAQSARKQWSWFLKAVLPHIWACPLIRTPWDSWIALKLWGTPPHPLILPLPPPTQGKKKLTRSCDRSVSLADTQAAFSTTHSPRPTAWYHLQNKHWWILTQPARSSFIFTFHSSHCLPVRFNVKVVTNTDFVTGCSSGKRILWTFLDAKKSG